MAEAILLVGGFGTRLRPLTNARPKPMLPLATLPVTEHQIAMVRRAGIKRIVLATSYLAEVFTPYFGDGSKWDMEILYAVESEPLGTGGAIGNGAQLLSGNTEVVVLNGDVLSSHEISSQLQFHKESSADITLHLTPVADARAYGCVPIDKEGRVNDFREKMDQPLTNTINAGCYIFDPKVIESIPPNQVISVERETFPNAVANHLKVMGYQAEDYWLDIGTPAALMKGSRDLVTGAADGDALDRYQFAHRDLDYISMTRLANQTIASGGSAIGALCALEDCSIESSIISDWVEAKECIIRNSFVEMGAKLPTGMVIESSFVDIDGEIYSFMG
ncbi:MAG: NDP-sugar synthase [Candidatus Nanopelagicaceae bacterium]